MKLRIILLTMVLVVLSVNAQPTDVVVEDFNDDDAVSFNGFTGGKNNVVTGSNPDGDFYFFVPITAGCGSSGSAMYVSEPGSLFTGFNHVWTTNVLVAVTSTSSSGPDCRTPTYQLVNDVAGQTSLIELDIFMAQTSSGTAQNKWIMRGEGAFIAQFCQQGNVWYVQSNPGFCAAGNGGLSFGTQGGDERIKVRFEFDWDAQTFTATILEQDKGVGTLQLDTPKTVAFANVVGTHEMMEVLTDSTDDTQKMITWIDNYILKGPQFDSEVSEGVEPPELESGIVAFAADWGFAEPASQKLFAIIFVAVAMILIAAITQFFSDSKMKNWIILGVGVGASSFFVFSGFAEIWEITIATVLGGSAVHGIRETLTAIATRRNDGGETITDNTIQPVIDIPEPEGEENV
jgi:hypothetical protein